MNFYRLMVGTILGYILTAQLTITMSLFLPFENLAENVLFSNLISFAIWVILFLCCFINTNIKKLIAAFIGLIFIFYFLNNYLLGVI